MKVLAIFKAGLFVCVSIALMMWGRSEMRIAAENRHPTTMTCEQFLHSSLKPGWYHLTGCQIDSEERVDKTLKYRDAKTNQPIVSRSYYLVYGSKHTDTASLILSVQPDDFQSDMDLMGMVVKGERDPDEGVSELEMEAAVKFGDHLSSHWVLLKQGESPSTSFGVVLMVIGVLLFLLSAAATLGHILSFRPKTAS